MALQMKMMMMMMILMMLMMLMTAFEAFTGCLAQVMPGTLKCRCAYEQGD